MGLPLGRVAHYGRSENPAVCGQAREEHQLSIGTSQTQPLIAVTTSEVRRSEAVFPTPQGEPPRHEMALGLKYLHALELAGAIPLVVPPLSPPMVEALLDRVDGLCLSGGPDLDPASYDEPPHKCDGPMEPKLDEFEIALTAAADRRSMPILAICRGLQLLNVARGGSLYQHLPDVVGEQINHRQDRPGAEPTHSVSLTQPSRLARILGSDCVQVNSFHHQAVARLGHNLVVTGRAPDGTVESIEAIDREFVVGVQWHAETLIDRAEQAALFRAFVDSAQRSQPGTPQLRVA
jgi:putative glutamine amidotransferase